MIVGRLPSEMVDAIAERAADLVLERLEGSTPERGWPEWLDVKTAARYLGCEFGAIRKLYERRKLRRYQEGNGCNSALAPLPLRLVVHRLHVHADAGLGGPDSLPFPAHAFSFTFWFRYPLSAPQPGQNLAD